VASPFQGVQDVAALASIEDTPEEKAAPADAARLQPSFSTALEEGLGAGQGDSIDAAGAGDSLSRLAQTLGFKR
jgi:hypothetical protein